MRPGGRGIAVKPLALGAALGLVLAALLAVPGSDAATTTRTLAITSASAHPQVPFNGFDGNPAKLFDLNRDGRMEIIAQNDNHWVYVFDSQTGAILAEVKSTVPAGWGARTFNGPEVAVFDSAGTVRLIIQSSAAVVGSYRLDMAASTSTHFTLVKEWERRLTDCYSGAGSDSKPVLADLDRDGRYEIILSTEESGIYALRENGQLYWKACIGGGNAEPAVADLNQDGWPEVVFGSDGGVVSVLNGRTGGYLWAYNVLSHFALQSGSMPVGVSIGQLDGQLGPDIVVGARDSHDAANWTNDHALLLALSSTGSLLWARQDPAGNPLTYTHPVIVDADGDGRNEVYWGDWNTIGHKPPYNEADSWKVTGPAHFYRYEANGSLAWRQSLNTYWSNKDLAVADVDGDGVQEVLANGPGSGGDGIWYLDARTGAKETFVGTTSWKVARAPVVADLWGTGTMQWVVEVGPADSTNVGGGILVYDTHAPYSAAWPHLPDPSLAAAPPPPPPPGGPFNATFKVSSPNEWWEQVDVTPSPARALAKVEVRVDGGTWLGMARNQWGSWTRSVHASAGTSVEFLATDTGAAASQSAPFTWLDGNLTKGSVTPGTPPPPPPPPPPSTFAPTFTPVSGVNEWWIELTVGTSEPLAGVDARVNLGSWTALGHTSWGTWAKSIHAAPGDRVQFRATTTYGATALSGNFTWLSSGGGPTVFAPTFEPRSQTNPWWVEVKVTGGIVAKVEASTNGGAWTNLPATSWGTWAKSYFVPTGAMVQFRATDDAGRVAGSASYRWG
jgi:hypothetical protein